MKTIDSQRYQMIKKAVMQRPEVIADVSIYLWERLACQLISIIGEGGFDSLFKRSLHLTSSTFSWMETDSPLFQGAGDSLFSDLKIYFDEKNSAEAGEACAALLICFIDILALLIGELLTSSILSLAWGDDMSYTVTKEFS